MPVLLDGQSLKRQLEKRIAKAIKDIETPLKLVVLLVGDSGPSRTYVQMKKNTCQRLGVNCIVHTFSKDVTEAEIIDVVREYNADESVTGILVQLPLPGHVSTRQVLDTVDIKKDVDGLHSYHLTKILLEDEKILPCTPKGILRLLEEYSIELRGKGVCIVGFSDVVGKPLATLCLNRSATVTVCHSETEGLSEYTSRADIVMTATGRPGLITKDMVKSGAVVVDIGISRQGERVVGDVDFEDVKDKCSYITPVPGGVGPMTVISLVENLIVLQYAKRDPDAVYS